MGILPIWVADADEEKLSSLASSMHVNTSATNDALIAAVDVVVLAVKPQVIAAVIQASKASFDKAGILLAVCCDKPNSNADFSIASISKKKYAGPLPDTAVTASNSDSFSTQTAIPTERIIFSARSCCSSLTFLLAMSLC
jgi:pyrroline-5-carboxylate reductase